MPHLDIASEAVNGNLNFQCNVLTMLAVVPEGLGAPGGDRLAGNRIVWGKRREDRSGAEQLLCHEQVMEFQCSSQQGLSWALSFLSCLPQRVAWCFWKTVPFYSSILGKMLFNHLSKILQGSQVIGATRLHFQITAFKKPWVCSISSKSVTSGPQTPPRKVPGLWKLKKEVSTGNCWDKPQYKHVVSMDCLSLSDSMPVKTQ